MPLLFSFAILLLFTEVKAGSNYYFSSSIGDDSRTSVQARNPTTPWKTITKLNSFSTSLIPGDSVLLKRGETYHGTINPLSSGTLANRIVLSSYGSGAKPIVTGFTPITGWTNEGGGIYSKVISGQSTPNIVIVNGINTPKGRWPNVTETWGGYLNIDSHSGFTSLTASELNSSIINWTGAEVVYKNWAWVINKGTISNHTGSTLTFNTGDAEEIKNNYGFFIQNDTRTFDVVGEWAFRSGILYMYFGANNPTDYTVKISTLDKNVYSTRSYITLHNLSFEGANVYGVHQSGGSYLNVLGCDIKNMATNGIYATACNYVTVNRCSIQNVNDHAVYLTTSCSNSYIGYNTIRNCSIIPGSSASGDNHMHGIFLQGDNETVEYNTMDVMGYLGMYVSGNNLLVRYNVIDSVCMIKADGSGIYVNGYLSNIMSNRIIEYNIVSNVIGNQYGASSTRNEGHGIYPDGYANNIIIRNNTVFNCAWAGIFLGLYTHDINVTDNLLYNNISNIYNGEETAPINNYTFTGNTMVDISDKYLFDYSSTLNAVSTIGTWSGNYYIKPFGDRAVARSSTNINGLLKHIGYTYDGWSLDATKHKEPVTITPYVINNYIGGNKVTNGTFNSNVTGFTGYSYGTHTFTWDNTNKITAGSARLEVTVPSTTQARSGIYTYVGVITAGKKYIVKFDIRGTQANKAVAVHLRDGSVYPTPQYAWYPYTTTASTVYVLLEPSASSSNCTLRWEFVDTDGTVYLDNVEFYEADVTKADPADHILFDYNATLVNKTVTGLSGYKSLDNVSVTSYTLEPYESIILIKP